MVTRLKRVRMIFLAAIMLLASMAVTSQPALAYTTKQLEIDCAYGSHQGSGTMIQVYGWNQNGSYIDGSLYNGDWSTNGSGIVETWNWWWQGLPDGKGVTFRISTDGGLNWSWAGSYTPSGSGAKTDFWAKINITC